MEVGELRKRLIKSRSKSKNQDISSDDIIRAIGKLKILGNMIVKFTCNCTTTQISLGTPQQISTIKGG